MSKYHLLFSLARGHQWRSSVKTYDHQEPGHDGGLPRPMEQSCPQTLSRIMKAVSIIHNVFGHFKCVLMNFDLGCLYV